VPLRLVGSEMCIRDSSNLALSVRQNCDVWRLLRNGECVSYVNARILSSIGCREKEKCCKRCEFVHDLFLLVSKPKSVKPPPQNVRPDQADDGKNQPEVKRLKPCCVPSKQRQDQHVCTPVDSESHKDVCPCLDERT
jgi:hypothetical protein